MSKVIDWKEIQVWVDSLSEGEVICLTKDEVRVYAMEEGKRMKVHKGRDNEEMERLALKVDRLEKDIEELRIDRTKVMNVVRMIASRMDRGLDDNDVKMVEIVRCVIQ